VAQNMIYTHTVSVYDREHELVTTIQDRITPADFGFTRWKKPVRGGPVEASFSPDGKHLWVSNYSMYGPGFAHPGDDVCSPSTGIDKSFLYRVDTSSWKVDGAVRVGAVPKFVEAAPDGRTVLVTNWCTWDLSVVDTASLKETARIPLGGRYPRGIAISPDSSTAYVAIMGGTQIVRVDLAGIRAGKDDDEVLEDFSTPGGGPRHLNLSPDGKYLYVTLNADGRVAKVDARTGKVLKRVSTGQAPRSSVLSPDGTALFVVNYESGTVSQVRTKDMKVLRSVSVDHHPIGITYNPATDEVWVCSYVGSITVFADRADD
jgi:YVTN family beta-propeller protein